MEKIHHEDFTRPVTGADMEEAKEKLIRERGTHRDSLMEKCYDPRIRPLVVQAFLQRVVNGGGSIIREMALGSGRLDLGVLFHGAKYAVEVKTAALYAKSHC